MTGKFLTLYLWLRVLVVCGILGSEFVLLVQITPLLLMVIPEGRLYPLVELDREILSPFLFILVDDCLSRLLDHSSSLGLTIAHLVNNTTFSLNHFQFVNDTLLFSIADRSTIQNLFEVVRIFEYVVGLRINFAKSELLGIHVPNSNLDWLVNSFGCKTGFWPSTYLGLPLGDNSNSAIFWQPVVEKF